MQRVRTQGLRSMNPLFLEPHFIVAMVLVSIIVGILQLI